MVFATVGSGIIVDFLTQPKSVITMWLQPFSNSLSTGNKIANSVSEIAKEILSDCSKFTSTGGTLAVIGSAEKETILIISSNIEILIASISASDEEVDPVKKTKNNTRNARLLENSKIIKADPAKIYERNIEIELDTQSVLDEVI